MASSQRNKKWTPRNDRNNGIHQNPSRPENLLFFGLQIFLVHVFLLLLLLIPLVVVLSNFWTVLGPSLLLLSRLCICNLGLPNEFLSIPFLQLRGWGHDSMLVFFRSRGSHSVTESVSASRKSEWKSWLNWDSGIVSLSLSAQSRAPYSPCISLLTSVDGVLVNFRLSSCAFKH